MRDDLVVVGVDARRSVVDVGRRKAYQAIFSPGHQMMIETQDALDLDSALALIPTWVRLLMDELSASQHIYAELSGWGSSGWGSGRKRR